MLLDPLHHNNRTQCDRRVTRCDRRDTLLVLIDLLQAEYHYVYCDIFFAKARKFRLKVEDAST